MISAQHVELPDSFIIEIEAPKVGQLIQEFGHDFNHMANFLKIMNKRMVLLNPVSIFERNKEGAKLRFILILIVAI